VAVRLYLKGVGMGNKVTGPLNEGCVYSIMSLGARKKEMDTWAVWRSSTVNIADSQAKLGDPGGSGW